MGLQTAYQSFHDQALKVSKDKQQNASFSPEESNKFYSSWVAMKKELVSHNWKKC